MKKQILQFTSFLFLLVLFSCLANGQIKTKKFVNGIPSDYLRIKVDKIPIFKFKPPDNFKNYLKNPDKNQSHEFMYKYAIEKDIEFDFIKESKVVSDNEYSYYTLTIVAEDAVNISLQFKEALLSRNSVLTIYTKFEVTDSILDKDLNNSLVWQTKAYHGNELTLLLKVPINHSQEKELKIGKISFGYRSLDTEFFGSPGASLPCHKNAICSDGALWSQNRNSIAHIQHGGGTYTGALIMNACNTNTPYLLTAKHNLTQAGVDPVAAIFVFKYLSTTCAGNTGYNEDIQFNGADVKATYAPTDFALYQLKQTPPAVLGLSFSGWDRNGETGIGFATLHHPAGDVMKMSIDYNNLEVSSWGGTNNHLVANFGYGAIEFGSSGGPLLNNSRRIIGQLHGNQQSMNQFCTELRAEFGRFNLSWDGGGTPETSLKYWLDPNNTGAGSTNTTNMSNLIDVSSVPEVLGDEFICSGFSTFTISTLPSNATITWTVSNPAVASIPNPSNGASVNVTKVGNGVITLTASVLYCSGEVRTATRSIMVGPSVGGYYTIISNYHNPAIQINLTNSNSPLWLPKNQGFGINAYINSPTVNSITWTRAANSYNFNYSTFNSILSFMGTSSGISYQQRNGIFNLTASTACGTYMGTFTWPIIAQGWSFSLKTSPNPATSTLSVTIENESDILKNLNREEIITIRLYNFNSNILLKEWKFGNDRASYLLTLPAHARGQYILVVKKGAEQQSKIIVLE